MKKSAIAAAVCAFALMIALLIDPQRYAQSVYNGLLLYCVSILPTMLPFFFLSGLLTGTGIAGKLGRNKMMGVLFHAPGEGLYVMAMAMLSGYPVGAKLTAELYDGGAIDQAGAAKLVAITSATGPLFMLGTVGTNILHDYTAGWCILGAHYAATVLNGLLYRGRKKAAGQGYAPMRPVDSNKLLWEAAYNTVISLLVAGVFVVMFNMVADVLADMGVLGALAKGMSMLGVPQDAATALAYGATEMTRGCILMAQTNLPMAWQAALCCLLVTGGGLCVALQSVAYLAKCHINPLAYLARKGTQAVLAMGLCYGLYRLAS